jgi:hypothetical protein
MDKLEISLNETLNTSDLKDVTKELIETGIDSILKDGLLKDIPIVNAVLGVYKLGVSIKDIIFFKKLLRFLYEINSTSVSMRQKVIAKIEQDDEFGRKVGETILMLLDRLDDLNKANMVGKLFKAIVEGRIDNNTFQRLCYLIDNVFINDIAELRKLKRGDSISYDIKNYLFICGLLKRTTLGDLMISGDNEFEINDYGKTLIFELYNE